MLSHGAGQIVADKAKPQLSAPEVHQWRYVLEHNLTRRAQVLAQPQSLSMDYAAPAEKVQHNNMIYKQID